MSLLLKLVWLLFEKFQSYMCLFSFGTLFSTGLWRHCFFLVLFCFVLFLHVCRFVWGPVLVCFLMRQSSGTLLKVLRSIQELILVQVFMTYLCRVYCLSELGIKTESCSMYKESLTAYSNFTCISQQNAIWKQNACFSILW